MIVQGKPQGEIDIEINPIGVVAQMIASWKIARGLCPSDRILRCGYWVNDSGDRIRLATREELKERDAFAGVIEILVEII